MGFFIENMGLDFLTETEERVDALIKTVAAEGEAVTGYYGNPYFDLHLGNCQLVLDTELNPERTGVNVTDFHTHCDGNTVWELRLNGMDLTPKGAEKTERTVAVSTLSGEGVAVVNILNADVLPSFMENDTVKLQMVAFATDFHYYKDAEGYEISVPADDLGRQFLLEDGVIFPTGMLTNRDPENENADDTAWMDSIALIRGKVKHIFWGTVKLGDEAHNTFLRVIIGTQFGDLMIVHTPEQVNEDERPNLAVGATFVGACALSGDAAIYEHENGIVRDEKNDLQIMRYTFVKGDAERLRTVLSDDIVYASETSGKVFTGKDDVINRLKYVRENADVEYFAHMATIIAVDDGEEALPYPVGTRCIVIAVEKPDKYESVAFLELNEDGNISKINISRNSRYHFALDRTPKPELPFSDGDFPQSFLSAAAIRAKYMKFVPDDFDEEQLKYFVADAMREKLAVDQILAAGSDGKLENVFGYLFAKGMEMKYTKNNPEVSMSFSPEDAWSGEFRTAAPTETAERLRIAMRHARSFHIDYTVHSPDINEALILMIRLGKASARYFLEQ